MKVGFHIWPSTNNLPALLNGSVAFVGIKLSNFSSREPMRKAKGHRPFFQPYCDFIQEKPDAACFCAHIFELLATV
jgi:hypothetical protein